MKTLKVYASEVIKIIDTIPEVVKFVVKVIKKIFSVIKEYFESTIADVSRERAPPVEENMKEGKGGPR